MSELGEPRPDTQATGEEPIEDREAFRVHGRNPLYKQIELSPDADAPRGPLVAFALGGAVVVIGFILLAIYWPVGVVIVGLGVLMAAAGLTRTVRTSVRGGRKRLGPDHTPV